MKSTLIKFTRLLIGFWFCALGIVLMINANLGLSPWDVLHQGISNITNITIGQANIGIGIIVVIVDIILGEKLGWGTILNMIVIGILIDFFMFNNLVPIGSGFLAGIFMMCLGMFSMGVGCVLYIGSGLGSGPRDGMMVALNKKTGKSIKTIRCMMELGVLIIGYFLGGTVGVGTLFTAIGLGYFMQFTFRLCKFDSAKVQHRFVIDDFNYIKVKYIIKNKIDADNVDELQNNEGM